MEPIFVKAHFDLYCDWEGLPPSYRIYVNEEMFAERTFIWDDAYLSEMLQISAKPGQYRIRIELLKPNLAKLKIYNHSTSVGPGKWIETKLYGGTLEIKHESE